MFVVAVLEDDLRLAPKDLSRPHVQALTDVINDTYLDKVLRDVGLCVSLYDILSISGGFVYPSDGGAHFTVRFRLLVFAPTAGEVLVGKICGADAAGIRVSLGFFSDIIIPPTNLQEPSVFDEEEKVWKWQFSGNDMYMDIDEQIRFRVSSVRYPPLPTNQDKGTSAFAPMVVTGDINADGLGLLAWWLE